MKILSIMLMIGFAIALNSEVSIASDNVQKILEAKETKPAKRKRRKKAEMCQECGKPEVNCDCEGHNDGHKDDHKKHDH